MPAGKGTYGSKKGRPKKKKHLGKYKGIDFIQKLRRKKLGIKKDEEAGRVGSKAKKAVKTKGGTYVKYEKKSKSAKSFRSAFKSACSGDAKSFSWQGRSYSCAKKSDKPKRTQVTSSQAKKDMNISKSTNYRKSRGGRG
tara:strand:+ start:204 stop:620 length:417 start_codon:yes stop_codon:yes gene_type:complete